MAGMPWEWHRDHWECHSDVMMILLECHVDAMGMAQGCH